ncbi:Uncharacterised protein [uncultured archaeon]|nr:Uncharacterised protein [uncultured archaeon]
MEKQILSLFLFNNKLKFNEVEKLLGVRSNKLDYHLKKLIKEGILEKVKEHYRLTETAEHLIPYISEKKSILPVILVKIGNEKEVFLHSREKRPYKGKLSLPGGRILFGEDISDATERIMLEKHNIKVKFERIESVSLENIYKKNKLVHSFFLILVSAKEKQKISKQNVEKSKKKMIESDYKLIKQKTPSGITIKKIKSEVE